MWGSHDPLVPAAFGRHVAKWLPDARQVTIDRCGHVPQVECPDQTNALLVSFFDEAERSGLVPSSRSHPDIRAA
jgi:pimeloyl-ACP methyl ester carboxylesterase